jgi:short subunit dehydrogenase-like uncharacterized protein
MTNAATQEVWILGANGRSGRAVAAALIAKQVVPVLVGRDELALRKLATSLGGNPRVVVAGSIESIGAAMQQSGPVVVFNTIGPFSKTAAAVIRASAKGSHYLDLSNELPAINDVLAMHEEAVSAGRCLVAGAGWGVLACESVVLKLCENKPGAERVRVAAMPFVDAPGRLGPTLAATILDGIPNGFSRYEQGKLVPVGAGLDYEELTLPDGSKAKTAGAPVGDLEAARRASQAPFVVAASSMAPHGVAVRIAMPMVQALMSIGAVRRFAERRLAAVEVKPHVGPPKPSWAHARIQWKDGTVREGFLRAGDAMDFTVNVATEVASRLARGEGKPGAYTPGALFGAGLAEACGGSFILDS